MVNSAGQVSDQSSAEKIDIDAAAPLFGATACNGRVSALVQGRNPPGAVHLWIYFIRYVFSPLLLCQAARGIIFDVLDLSSI
jgi:hypothetical protein